MIGESKRKYNLFRWSEVDLNFPGDLVYQPHLPWVYKRIEEWCVTVDLLVYVDDGRPEWTTEDYYWQAYMRWVSVCTHLGIQNALRNLEPPSQQPGPWSGTVTRTDKGALEMIYQIK